MSNRIKMSDIEGELKQWELYKSYGEFNLLFENSIQSLRILLIALIRIAYSYSADEDDNGNELDEEDQDRLVKILMQNMGAMEILENTKACFIDFFDQQKKKHRDYIYFWNDTELTLTKLQYDFALEVFKQCKGCIQLRNKLIHSNYFIPYMEGFDPVTKLSGSKDAKTSKGYEKRKHELSIDFLIGVNTYIDQLKDYIMWIERNLHTNDVEFKASIQGKRELDILKAMDFSVPLNLG